jgi:hypothetical protein
VQVLGCLPACYATHGWALVEPRGAVRLAALSRSQPVDAPSFDENYLYGHVVADDTSVFAEPDTRAKVIRREMADWSLAFVEDPELLKQGWYRSASEGYLLEDEVRLASSPSEFAGVFDPPEALAFLLKDTAVAGPKVGSDSGPAKLARHAVRPVLSLEGRGRVEVPEGSVPRWATRLAIRQPRPAEIPPGAKWVFVSLTEQTLTAYEGDREVFATMVSTGKPGYRTPTGTFQVWEKVRHATMNGRRQRYHVEEVPDVMFFHGSYALHAAFWHDSFGRAITHGCINLSPRDAAWLFDWAPPSLPEGWHTTLPQPGDESLWVVIAKTVQVPRLLAPSHEPNP